MELSEEQKARMMLNDLGKSRREDIVMTDEKHRRTREVSRVLLESARLSNQPGTREHINKEKNKEAVKAWSSAWEVLQDDLGGITQEDAADGQSHRAALTDALREAQLSAPHGGSFAQRGGRSSRGGRGGKITHSLPRISGPIAAYVRGMSDDVRNLDVAAFNPGPREGKGKGRAELMTATSKNGKDTSVSSNRRGGKLVPGHVEVQQQGGKSGNRSRHNLVRHSDAQYTGELAHPDEFMLTSRFPSQPVVKSTIVRGRSEVPSTQARKASLSTQADTEIKKEALASEGLASNSFKANVYAFARASLSRASALKPQVPKPIPSGDILGNFASQGDSPDDSGDHTSNIIDLDDEPIQTTEAKNSSHNGQGEQRATSKLDYLSRDEMVAQMEEIKRSIDYFKCIVHASEDEDLKITLSRAIAICQKRIAIFQHTLTSRQKIAKTNDDHHGSSAKAMVAFCPVICESSQAITKSIVENGMTVTSHTSSLAELASQKHDHLGIYPTESASKSVSSVLKELRTDWQPSFGSDLDSFIHQGPTQTQVLQHLSNTNQNASGIGSHNLPGRRQLSSSALSSMSNGEDKGKMSASNPAASTTYDDLSVAVSNLSLKDKQPQNFSGSAVKTENPDDRIKYSVKEMMVIGAKGKVKEQVLNLSDQPALKPLDSKIQKDKLKETSASEHSKLQGGLSGALESAFKKPSPSTEPVSTVSPHSPEPTVMRPETDGNMTSLKQVKSMVHPMNTGEGSPIVPGSSHAAASMLQTSVRSHHPAPKAQKLPKVLGGNSMWASSATTSTKDELGAKSIWANPPINRIRDEELNRLYAGYVSDKHKRGTKPLPTFLRGQNSGADIGAAVREQYSKKPIPSTSEMVDSWEREKACSTENKKPRPTR